MRYLKGKLAFGGNVSKNVQNCMFLREDYTCLKHKFLNSFWKWRRFSPKIIQTWIRQDVNRDVLGFFFENLWFCYIK